ncbi:MAG TPA: S1 RNA-binding domain-containing protein [Candidatus Blautia stercoripullorum]|uniref:S1 RNA-binding domain-containing protein n=1 Tax=Candidatus Blautia stercoripullorum TaxID=2838502 RepID=A0A9D2U5R8_9FIRM|nr:S1 RNA-binding domain-containing protein [Candidatus Blautia stercoripullorum]
MSEETKKQETMEDYMTEINASFSDFRDDDMLIWDKLAQMKEDKTDFEVTVEGIVKGGVIAYVEGIRAFIPVSQLDLHYVENPEDYLKKTLTVRVLELDEQENRLVLSAKEVLKDKAQAEKLEKIQNIKVGSIVEGTVESLQTYGAFIDLGDHISGLVHISQISEKRIKSPKAVLSIGDSVKAKVIKNEDGKISLSMKALAEPQEEKSEEPDFELPKSEDISTSLGSLLKNLKIDG